MSELADTKAQLEVEKLKLEMRYIRRNHLAQVVNTAGIVVVGLVVFYFFQRPQLDHMEHTRLAAEKQQVASLVMTALNLENERDRSAMIKSLNALWPQYEFINAITQSNLVLAEKPLVPPQVPSQATQPGPEVNQAAHSPAPPSPEEKFCKDLGSHLERLRHSEEELILQARSEEAGIGVTRRPVGRGPAYRSLMAQAQSVRAQIEQLKQIVLSQCAHL